MADISQVKLPNGDTYNLVDETSGYITTSIYSGTCASEAADTTKVVTCADFTELKAGAAILVTFSTTNSAAVADLMMNVNGTGAKKIQYINNGTRGNLSSAGYLKASTTYLFVYDGTYWVVYLNYNTTYSSMTDAEITAGTGTTARTITPARLKTAVETWAPEETDPIFSASAAAGITSTDISNWNNMVPITNGSMFINNDGNNNGFIVEYGETNIIQVAYNQTNQNNETHIHYVVTPVANGDAANKKYVDDSIGAISIPTKVSDLTNDSNFTAKSTTTVTLTTTWSSKTQTVSVTGVTASNTVIITPTPASYNAYCEYGVYCSAQSSGTLTFTCDEVPTSSLTVNVLILN